MLKKNISSVELAAIIHELQFLVGGKLSQIYDYEEKALLLQVHVPHQGKLYLRILPGKFLNVTQKKESPLTPSSFCLQLRKHLDHATIAGIEQLGGERIAVFKLQKEQVFVLIVEFFAKGNIILTDDQQMILGVLDQHIFKDRAIKPGLCYAAPPPPANWKAISEKELFTLASTSSKKNIAITLALELGLGGMAAEELCQRSHIEKSTPPSQIDEPQATKLWQALQELKKNVQEPKGYFYAEDISPFPLLHQRIEKETAFFNEALDAVKLQEKISPYKKKIAALEKQILSQEEAITSLQQKIELLTRKGEILYERYGAVKEILERGGEARKSGSWEKVAIILQQDKQVKRVDLKDKKVTLEL